MRGDNHAQATRSPWLRNWSGRVNTVFMGYLISFDLFMTLWFHGQVRGRPLCWCAIEDVEHLEALKKIFRKYFLEIDYIFRWIRHFLISIQIWYVTSRLLQNSSSWSSLQMASCKQRSEKRHWHCFDWPFVTRILPYRTELLSISRHS